MTMKRHLEPFTGKTYGVGKHYNLGPTPHGSCSRGRAGGREGTGKWVTGVLSMSRQHITILSTVIRVEDPVHQSVNGKLSIEEPLNPNSGSSSKTDS